MFTLQEQDRGIFRQNHYYKNYQTGPLAGQSVRISKGEFEELKEEAELLWGRVDWRGDWVPGLLRRKLPVIDDYCTAHPRTLRLSISRPHSQEGCGLAAWQQTPRGTAGGTRGAAPQGTGGV